MSKKVNNNLEITSVCSTLYLCNKMIPYFNHFALHGMIFFKETISITEVFHFKTPCLGFSFLPPVSFEIFSTGISSRVSIFPPIDWPLKSDYSSLYPAPLLIYTVPQCKNLFWIYSKHLCLVTRISLMTILTWLWLASLSMNIYLEKVKKYFAWKLITSLISQWKTEWTRYQHRTKEHFNKPWANH